MMATLFSKKVPWEEKECLYSNCRFQTASGAPEESPLPVPVRRAVQPGWRPAATPWWAAEEGAGEEAGVAGALAREGGLVAEGEGEDGGGGWRDRRWEGEGEGGLEDFFRREEASRGEMEREGGSEERYQGQVSCFSVYFLVFLALF